MLFSEIEEIRKNEKLDVIFDGSNWDDTRDYRPGMKAAREYRVISPLMRCRFTKKDIRKLSKILGLRSWNRPQNPCLSSRVSYGTPISVALIKRISKVEELLKSIGHVIVRARVHGDILRIEIDRSEKVDIDKIRKVVPKIKKQGFRYIVLDLEGYRTGSMNE